MNVNKNIRAVFNMATGGLLVVGLFLLLNGPLQVAHADPGELFVSPDGTGTDCTQATPCALPTGLDIAKTNGEDDTIYLAVGTYEGNFTYAPLDARSLIISGEPRTTAQDIILDGGGDGTVLYLSCSGEGGSVSVENLTIQNGSESGLRVSCRDGSLDVTLSHVVIQNNINEYRGGGIYLRPYENATINMEVWDSIIKYNQSPGRATGGQGRGGGIQAHTYAGNSTIDLLIVNSLIYKNQANWSGGGINVSASEVGDNNVTRAMVINSTITGNVLTDPDTGWGPGAGIDVVGFSGNGAIASLDLYNTIIYDNTLPGEEAQDLTVIQDDPGNTTVNAYHSDIGNVFISTWTGNTPTYNPVNVLNADPVFAYPEDDDYHLSSGSPCIDAGTTAIPDPPGLPTIDFEGDSRVIGAAPDIGADEYRYTHHIYMPLVMKNYP